MTRLFIPVDDALHRQLKAEAAAQGKSMTDLVTALIEKYLTRKKVAA